MPKDFSETLLNLLCKQFALEEGWNWDNLDDTQDREETWSKLHIRKQVFQILNTFAPNPEEDNYFKSCTKASGANIEINGELVKHYLETNNLQAMLDLFNFLMRCRERAEYLSRSYLSQLENRSQTLNLSSSKPKSSKSLNLDF